MVDIVWRLKRLKGQAVEYRGKPYILFDVKYKKTGTEEVFGKTIDVVDARAELCNMDGYRSVFYVPAEEVSASLLKWDFEESKWYSPTEQLSVV